MARDRATPRSRNDFVLSRLEGITGDVGGEAELTVLVSTPLDFPPAVGLINPLFATPWFDFLQNYLKTVVQGREGADLSLRSDFESLPRYDVLGGGLR